MSPLPTASLSPAGAGVARGAVNGGVDGRDTGQVVRARRCGGGTVCAHLLPRNSEECLRDLTLGWEQVTTRGRGEERGRGRSRTQGRPWRSPCLQGRESRQASPGSVTCHPFGRPRVLGAGGTPASCALPGWGSRGCG